MRYDYLKSKKYLDDYQRSKKEIIIMGFIKKLLGIEAPDTSTDSEISSSEVLDNDTPNIIINDIITYRKEDDIVYGYLNQIALDAILYKRAQERTHNFKVKDQWEGERNKRPVTPFDINICDHTICDHPIVDGEYVSEGDIILAIGLDSLKFSNYCSSNRVSELETMLYCGVKIYSRYGGYFTNNIKDNIIAGCNLGNTIKDGDLLFSMKLANKPESIESSITEVRFSHSMLSKDFLDDIPYLKDITFKQWLVDDYTKVNKGDDVLEITEYTTVLEPRYSTTIKAPKTGILIKSNILPGKLTKGTILFSMVEDESMLAARYPNEVLVSKDDFTKAITIKGKCCAGDKTGFKLGTIQLNFENVGGISYILIVYPRMHINLNKNCALHLLLDDGSVITLNASANPIKLYSSNSTIKYHISKDDLIKLRCNNFIKWQITNEEGLAIDSGVNICCVDRNDTTGVTMDISFEVFRNFVNDFLEAIEKNVTEDSATGTEPPTNINVSETCYVYLMKDIANNFHKIGISRHLEYREHTLQSDKPTIELLCAKEYPNRTIALAIEAALHKVYSSKRLRGEWFNLDDSDVKDVIQTLK